MAECSEPPGATPSAGERLAASSSRLFLAFLRLGLTAFGGPAMVVYIRDLAVKKHGWLSEESFEGGVSLCQTIPGATAMQTAAYVGLRAGGPFGAVAAFVGFGLPAFILMVILSVLYGETRDLLPVTAAFRGLHVVVVALVAHATLNFGWRSVKNWRDVLLTAGVAAFLGFHGSPILAVVAAAAAGLVLYRGMDLKSVEGAAGGQGETRRLIRFAAILAGVAAIGLALVFCLNRALGNLAALMMKVDVFAFGGGFASVPLLFHEVVAVRQWMDSRTLMDGIALGQVTPGPIVITATFVGYQIAGLAGALVATLGIFTPSFLMVLVTVPYFDRLQRSPTFRRALRGILASFVGLLIAVTVRFGLEVSWTIPSVILGAAALAALRLRIDILWVVLVGGLVSVLIL